MFETLIKEFAQLEEVEAIALGGSRATENYDQHSDYDVYVYLNNKLDETKRKAILEKYCSYMEYSNSFWELEDDGILNNKIEIEFIYRDLDFLPSILDSLFVDKNVGNGYTTCFYDNLLSSKILFERNEYLSKLKQKYNGLYTKEIASLIINNNRPLLSGTMPAMYGQIKKATKRNDQIAINHRITEFFAIYFDILFALNITPHPGEKRLLEYSMKLGVKPPQLEEYVNTVFSSQYSNFELLLEMVNKLIDSVDELIEEFNE